jgi:hypothetical protein
METNNTFAVQTARKDTIKSRNDLFKHARCVKTNMSAQNVIRFLNDDPKDHHVMVTKTGSEPVREYIIHYRPGCPNTARAIGAIEQMPNGARLIMHSANDKSKNRKLRAFLSKEYPDKPVTYPRIFTQDGILVGGATELIDSLKHTK